MVLGDYLPYKFLWPSYEEWLQAVMVFGRYDLLKKKHNEEENKNEFTRKNETV